MAYVTFENKQDFYDASQFCFRNKYRGFKTDIRWGFVALFQGKSKGLHNCVFIYQNLLLAEFDKANINYRNLKESDLETFLSDSGKKKLEETKKKKPNLLI